jgi:hypothetical protein
MNISVARSSGFSGKILDFASFSGLFPGSGFSRIITNLGFFKQKRHQIHKLKENNKTVMMIQKKKMM